jgi:hypothetical protein
VLKRCENPNLIDRIFSDERATAVKITDENELEKKEIWNKKPFFWRHRLNIDFLQSIAENTNV